MYQVIVKHIDGSETKLVAESKPLASFAVASVVSVLHHAGIEPDQHDLDTMHLDEVNLILHMVKNDMVVATITATPISPMSLN